MPQAASGMEIVVRLQAGVCQTAPQKSLDAVSCMKKPTVDCLSCFSKAHAMRAMQVVLTVRRFRCEPSL